MAVARRDPESLTAWANGAEVWTGRRLGDTTEVLLHQPIWLRFMGSGDEVRVVAAGSLSGESSGIDRRFSGFRDLPW